MKNLFSISVRTRIVPKSEYKKKCKSAKKHPKDSLLNIFVIRHIFVSMYLLQKHINSRLYHHNLIITTTQKGLTLMGSTKNTSVINSLKDQKRKSSRFLHNQ